jgi:hypothetical protein
MTTKELLDRALGRDKRFEKCAIDASRDNDRECLWMAMALRAENKRFIEKLKRAINAEAE